MNYDIYPKDFIPYDELESSKKHLLAIEALEYLIDDRTIIEDKELKFSILIDDLWFPLYREKHPFVVDKTFSFSYINSVVRDDTFFKINSDHTATNKIIKSFKDYFDIPPKNVETVKRFKVIKSEFLSNLLMYYSKYIHEVNYFAEKNNALSVCRSYDVIRTKAGPTLFTSDSVEEQRFVEKALYYLLESNSIGYSNYRKHRYEFVEYFILIDQEKSYEEKFPSYL